MKAIIIGATSGIGEALAHELAKQGYQLGLTGRRVDNLNAIQQQLQSVTKTYVQTMDVTHYNQAQADLLALIEQMGGVDVVVINAGVGSFSPKWEAELDIINTNVTGFCAIAHTAFTYFSQQKKGHLVGISSVAAVRGGAQMPAYNASKAFISSYMEGLRQKSLRKNLNITITDIRPGFVKTPMTEQNRFMFWVATAQKAAAQIAQAINNKRKVAYITRRWLLAAWVLRLLPDKIMAKMG